MQSGHRIRHLVFAATLIGSVSAVNSGCITTTGDELTAPPEPLKDEAYAPVYKRSTKSYEFVENFETRFELHVTNLSADFLGAFAGRYRLIFNQPPPMLEEAATKASFFVSIYALHRPAGDLANERLWTVQLRQGGEVHQPTFIRRVQPKEVWTPFFPGITPWSHEFLVAFDLPALKTDGQAMVKEASSVLELSNPDGAFKIPW